MILLIASATGALGAIMRYLVSGWVQEATGTDFPAGTATVNLVGSFLLGLVVGNGSVDSALTLTAVGFLGGFTTFSTWMIETIPSAPDRPERSST